MDAETESFEVPCGSCGRPVVIRSVSEFHDTAGGLAGYSYMIVCNCGSRVAVDGAEGGQIPEPMKTAAALRWRAYRTRTEIDLDRRSLPASNAKIALREARVGEPRLIGAERWIVYELENGAAVCYSATEKSYGLTRFGNTMHFDSVAALADYLNTR